MRVMSFDEDCPCPCCSDSDEACGCEWDCADSVEDCDGCDLSEECGP